MYFPKYIKINYATFQNLKYTATSASGIYKSDKCANLNNRPLKSNYANTETQPHHQRTDIF